MDLLGRDKLYATEWVERTFEYVRSARTVLRETGELSFILTFQPRDFEPRKDLDDIIAISESVMIYDINLYIDSYYFIYQVGEETTHKVGHIYTEDLLAYNRKLITFEQVMEKLEYTSLLETDDKDRS